MGITVRRAKHGKWNRERRNWLVIDHVSIINADTFTGHTVIRTYTCTNWTDAMRIADDVENRVRNIAGAYRGTVAIHAGLKVDQGWIFTPAGNLVNGWTASRSSLTLWQALGAIIGVVDLVDVHTECRLLDSSMATCSPWAEPHAYHLEFAHPRALATPIPFNGALGLRELDAATEVAIWEQVSR